MDSNSITLDGDLNIGGTNFNLVPSDDEELFTDFNNFLDDKAKRKLSSKVPEVLDSSDDEDDGADPIQEQKTNFFTSNAPAGGTFFNDEEDDDDDDGGEVKYKFPGGIEVDDTSDFSGSEYSAPPPATGFTSRPKLSPHAESKEKRKLLFRIDRLRKAQMVSGRNFTMASNIDDIRDEYEKLSYNKNLEKGVRIQENAVKTFASGVEWANNFMTLGFSLNGWSEAVAESIDDGEYNDVFEELYDKHSDKFEGFPPELRLVAGISMSAVVYHVATSRLQGDGFGQEFQNFMNENADVQKRFANKMVSDSFRGASQPQPQRRRAPMPSADPADLISQLDSIAPPVPPRAKPSKPATKSRRRKKTNNNELVLDL